MEPFFGAGGMYFNKPKAKYNILNDLDSDVFNLFQVVQHRAEELAEAFTLMPAHIDLFNYWKTNKEADPMRKALRFLLLSNFSLYGKDTTFRSDNKNAGKMLIERIKETQAAMFGATFTNYDFRQIVKKGIYGTGENRNSVFWYCDPPYLGTGHNYESGFTEQDSLDLFDMLEATGSPWAMSEFDHPFIVDQATKRGLNIYTIGERYALKIYRKEILVTNYKVGE